MQSVVCVKRLTAATFQPAGQRVGVEHEEATFTAWNVQTEIRNFRINAIQNSVCSLNRTKAVSLLAGFVLIVGLGPNVIGRRFRCS